MGGQGKSNVLRDAVLSTRTILDLTFRKPCSFVIEDLRAPFNDFYLFVDYWEGLKSEVDAMYEEMREENPRVQEARRNLQSSDAFLGIL